MLWMLLGIVLVIAAFPVGMFVSPMLIMVGAMGASDDPNVSKVYFTLGFAVCIFAIVLPIAMFVGGLILII